MNYSEIFLLQAHMMLEVGPGFKSHSQPHNVYLFDLFDLCYAYLTYTMVAGNMVDRNCMGSTQLKPMTIHRQLSDLLTYIPRGNQTWSHSDHISETLTGHFTLH